MKKCILGFLLILPILLQAQDIEATFENSAGGAFLVEGCMEMADTITFSRSDASRGQTFELQVLGSATAGADFTLGIADSLVFDVGQRDIKVPVFAIPDNDQEDRETIVLNILDSNGNVLETVSILILDELEVVIEPESVEVCQGESVTLSTVIPAVYQWIIGSDTVEAMEVTFVASEEMTVHVNAQIGSCTASDEIDIQLRTGITFNVDDTTYVCLGESATITVDIIGNPAGDYVWTPMDSSVNIQADQSIVVTPEVTTTYYLMFTNSDCAVTDSVVVRVDSLPPLPIAVIPEKETYCPGEKVTLISKYLYPPDFPDVKFEWAYTAGTPISPDTLENFVFTTEDTSYYRLKAINNACEVEDSVLLNVINPPVNLSLNDTTVCPLQPVKVVLLNAEDFDEIMWSPEMGISCTECADPTIRVPESTTFTLMGMSMGCPASGSVNVNIFPPDFIPVVPDTTVCPGEPVRLSAVTANLYEELEWSGQNLDCEKCDNPTATPGEASTYQVFGTKPDGCIGQGGVLIRTFSIPRPTVIATPDGAVEIGTIITLESGIEAGSTFTWFVNGQQIQGNETSIQAVLPSEGDNTFKVEVISPEGCMGMGEIKITGNPPKYEIPNAFTPNGDELNDTFKVLIFGNFKLSEFKIFNRWGQLVFEGTGENGWDGRHDGKAAPSDVYAYQAVLELLDGSLKTVRGEVTLIR
ncbi:MAG: gliding motility-associated C-terminal domain-containing protein [Saprospiraceae bacterium]|nr:gliding motility-associated C-terminal domain-containing protein [Saprospiraceae bacterium]